MWVTIDIPMSDCEMVNTGHVTTYYIPGEEKQRILFISLSDSAVVCWAGSLLIARDQTETLLDTNTTQHNTTNDKQINDGQTNMYISRELLIII